MPPLALENDTYREFFSGENCRSITENNRELEMIFDFSDSIPQLIGDEIRQMAEKGQLHLDDNNEDFELIPLLAKTLKEILSDFQNSLVFGNELKKCFSVFKKKRTNTIKSLREISQKINTDTWNCNISTEVGAVTGIVGGCLLVGGAIATFLTLGAALPLFVAGGITTGLGTGTTFGTAVTQQVLLEQDKAKVLKFIEEDRQNLQFSKYLDQSYDTKEIVENIIGVDFLKKTINDILAVLNKTSDFKKKINEMQGQIRTWVNSYLKHNIFFSNINFWITTLSLIIGFVFALVSIHKQNRLVYESGMAILKIGLTVCRLLDIGVDSCTAGFSLLRAGGAVVAKSVGRAAFHGTLAVLGMSLDIATVVLTSIDIHNGSISETATKINEIADKLEKELELLQIIYDDLN